MKETITIKNFGGLKDVTIPLNSINIFIGKQAAGKSVTAKLIYFFRKAFEDIFDGLSAGKNQKEIEEEIVKRFNRYFPASNWSKGNFFVQYESGNEYKNNKQTPKFDFGIVRIERKSKNAIKIIISDSIKEQLSKLHKAIEKTVKDEEVKRIMPNLSTLQGETLVKFLYHLYLGDKIKPFGLQIFVPAGRSFFSNIQNSIYSFLSEERPIDPFLIEFGAVYSSYKIIKTDGKANKSQKHIQDSLLEITDGEFFSDKTGDYLIHKDGRKINLLFCSSGQQEVLPLGLILRNFAGAVNSMEIISNTLYIEEPEAHLFPTAQKKIVEVIATAHNLAKGNSQLIITTHSPYILTSFNNQLQAGQLLESGADKKKLFKIIPEFEILKPGELNAYAFADGGVTSLIDEETGLISADLLDGVSEEIAVEFDELLNL